jgi:hypothetical protein
MPIQLLNRFLLAATISLSLTSIALADNSAVLGSWAITIEDGGFDDVGMETTLVIEEDDDGSLTGVWETDRGDDDLEDVTWDGKTLSFVRYIEILGDEVEVEHTATVDGDTLEGDMEGPRRDFEFSGERELED